MTRAAVLALAALAPGCMPHAWTLGYAHSEADGARSRRGGTLDSDTGYVEATGHARATPVHIVERTIAVPWEPPPVFEDTDLPPIQGPELPPDYVEPRTVDTAAWYEWSAEQWAIVLAGVAGIAAAVFGPRAKKAWDGRKR